VPVDSEKHSEHFWSANLVMKIKIEEIMGDQRIFGSIVCHFGFCQKIILQTSLTVQNRLFCLNAHAEGKCVVRYSDEKHSKLNAESNGIVFI
jgi:hypothetical protein